MGKLLKASLLLIISSYSLFAQCSDAGVCAIGSEHAALKHQIGMSYLFGASGKPDDIVYHLVQLEAGLQLLPASRVTLLLPWVPRISGPLGSTSGLGDLILLWNQGVWGREGEQINIQIGAKLATGSVNSGSLPQSYQPGLGTNDLLLGVTYQMDPWLFALGYQLSRGRSDNAVTRLKRGDDFLGRIGYTMPLEKFVVGLEVLAIKRLQESSILDTTGEGTDSFVDVPGSDQLQVNLLGRVELPIDQSFTVRSFVALPLRDRSVNVDGLKRSLSLSLGVLYTL
ncbi:hypothetical protein EHM92_01055 [bacterium]|nr:MAG: hypothetical protein EHM92_01055 [bacterium]